MKTSHASLALGLTRSLIMAVTLLLISAMALADAKGTYKASVNLDESVSSGKLEYKLDLKGGSDATLEIKRTSRLRLDNDAISNYGDQVTFLESPETVNLTGSWSQDGDEVHVSFNRVKSREDSDQRNVKIDLYKDDKGYRVDSWTQDFFGNTNKPRFVISQQHNGDALLAGLALLAAGALIASDKSSSELSYETRGNGRIQFGNGDRSTIDSVKIDLRSNKNGTIKFKGDDDVEIKGTWRSDSMGYLFQVSEIIVSGTRRKASGTLDLDGTRDGQRKRIDGIGGSIRVDDDDWRTVKVDFSGRD